MQKISGPPGLSMATVHGPPAIYERGHGLGFGYKWLACRVSLKGLHGRVRLQGLSWGDQMQRSGRSGGPQFVGGGGGGG